jgi:membrane protein implicated in regulation of membrane protease activity
MDWIENVYLICAAVGGTILVVQTVLLALGGADHAGDADAGHGIADHGGVDNPAGHPAEGHASESTFLHWLSFKTIVSFMTFFGLAGLAGGRAEWPAWVTLLVAILAGLSGLVVVAWLMASFMRLQTQGNLDLKNALGATGKVYLRIPGSLSGSGKVTVEVQGRSIEAKAMTSAGEIPTGTPVRVVAVNGDLLEVAPLQ